MNNDTLTLLLITVVIIAITCLFGAWMQFSHEETMARIPADIIRAGQGKSNF